jgi:diacylglycerol kinase (ATP)
MLLVLHNPLSNNNKSIRETFKFTQQLQKNNIQYLVRNVRKISNYDELLNDPQIKEIILLGGDGSLHWFVENIKHLKIKKQVYLYPNGSGNDFYRSLTSYTKNPVYYYSIRLNNQNHSFINTAGIGLDGMVTQYTSKKGKRGPIPYFINTLKAFIKAKSAKADLLIDEKLYTFRNTYMVEVCNGKFFGGGMKVSPDSKIENEDLNVIIINDVPKWKLFFIFLTIYKGNHIKFKKYVHVFTGKKISIKLNGPFPSQTDGELHENIRTFDVDNSHKLKLSRWTFLEE